MEFSGGTICISRTVDGKIAKDWEIVHVSGF